MGLPRRFFVRGHRAAPLNLLALFVLLSGIPLIALGWLGWRVMQQERALESQRLRERLESGAALIARELDRSLTAWEELLPAAAGGAEIRLPADSVFLLVGADGVTHQRGARLPYYPRVPVAKVDAAIFADAERHEFLEQNLTAAVAAYRRLAVSRDEAIRAEALMRLARCLRKQRRDGDAIAVYAELATLAAQPVAGSPAELVARRERVALFAAGGDAAAAARERLLLMAAVSDGRFPLDRATYEYFRNTASNGSATAAPDPRAAALAQAVEALWPAWQEQKQGRSALTIGAGSFITVWRTTPAGLATVTGGIDSVTASVRDALATSRVTAQLDDVAGARVWGAAGDGPRLTKTPRETGLPWAIHVAAEPGTAGLAGDSRRSLLAAGFALMALIVSAASYFVFRAVNRELRVARLQSDFVAAVSHEFRTPLTAMCHLTEILEEGGAAPDRLPEFYRALGSESRRLRTMVEDLLDFGRLDSGRRTYEFCETDALQLVDRVAQEFSDRSTTAAKRIEQAAPPAPARTMVIRADREALALALRNLVDNAMKYSPESSPVRLSVAPVNGSIAVSITDRGPGVTAQERREIFRKFTRGSAARALNVKGTGIGLTMAHQIVRAHGGRLELESEPGRGSTFTMVLPAVPQ